MLFNLNKIYIKPISYTIIGFIVLILVKFILKKISKLIKGDKLSFEFFNKGKLIINIIYIVFLCILWNPHITNIITLLSVISAGFVLAIRDVILNIFCGLYIKTYKPFKLEDGISVDGTMGDVVAINLLSFEILEVASDNEYGLSTGVIVHIPSSNIISKDIKNLSKGFKYIWDEMEIVLDKDADLKKSKATIYKIINNIEVVKKIPKKMKAQLEDFKSTYRIYYNNYNPIIYTRVDDGKVRLILRFLIHPKKARFVESIVWNKILEEEEKGNIRIFKED